MRPEAAEGAGVAAGPVGGADVPLQPARQEEAALAVLAAVRPLDVVATHHVTDGETCGDTDDNKNKSIVFDVGLFLVICLLVWFEKQLDKDFYFFSFACLKKKNQKKNNQKDTITKYKLIKILLLLLLL